MGSPAEVAAIGAQVDDFYAPEEKTAFVAKLETPQTVPIEINIYDVAYSSGFTDLTAKRLYQSTIAKHSELWPTLDALQSRRLLDKNSRGNWKPLHQSCRLESATALMPPS